MIPLAALSCRGFLRAFTSMLVPWPTVSERSWDSADIPRTTVIGKGFRVMESWSLGMVEAANNCRR